MSKIQQLVEKLCPNGVEYHEIGNISQMARGQSITKKDLTRGKVPVIAGGRKPAYFHAESNRTGVNIVIAGSGAYAGFVSYWDEPIYVSDAFTIKVDESRINAKYCFHFLKSKQKILHSFKSGGGVPHVYIKNVAPLRIPVPPLEVQEEIVRILDSFTELEAELKAELEKRTRQYEYCRTNLLKTEESLLQDGSFQFKPLKEVCLKISSGGTPLSSNREYYAGDIPWLRTQEVNWGDIFDTQIKITDEALKNSSAKIIPKNCVIVAMYGATAAKVAINKIPLTTNQACCNLQIDPEIANYKYIYYCLSESYEKLKSLGKGSQSNLNAKIIKDFKIPIPSVIEQNNIVEKLDRFYNLLANLNYGLPAEIEARRKQYEYYRDQLLTFKELEPESV